MRTSFGGARHAHAMSLCVKKNIERGCCCGHCGCAADWSCLALPQETHACARQSLKLVGIVMELARQIVWAGPLLDNFVVYGRECTVDVPDLLEASALET